VQQLWRQIIRSTADSAFALTVMSDKGCQAEITNFNLHSFCKEQITEFQVPMNDFFRMDVLNSLDHLVEVEAGLTVMETLTSLDQV